eukprot:TRINITY_DN8104_c0_g6_i2.p1 TRINITY_DN8104_c0_g6~~TRINITY_DN8104_c0_g6_i2.p1  ORF type:complete len:529 (+),score=113.93 TRINITY_DN8104_c0_g6_i2:126-1712(+)
MGNSPSTSDNDEPPAATNEALERDLDQVRRSLEPNPRRDLEVRALQLRKELRRLRAEGKRIEGEAGDMKRSAAHFELSSRAQMLLGKGRNQGLYRMSKECEKNAQVLLDRLEEKRAGMVTMRQELAELETNAGGTFLAMGAGTLSYLGEVEDYFEITKQLGAGGFGQVFLATRRPAWHSPEEPEYAVKRVKLAGSLRESVESDLRQEELALSICDHDNIVKLICSFRGCQQISLVMANVTGVELRKLVGDSAQGGFGEQRSRLILEQLAGAVAHVHSLGILHRDINPKNVMVSSEPRGQPDYNDKVTLLDFGLCIVLPEAGVELSVCYTQGGGFMGYRSPEMLSDADHSYPTDLYSIGCLMHLMLTGSAPFSDRASEAERRRVPVPGGICSAEALSLMEWLLEEDPGQRCTIRQLRRHDWLGGDTEWELVSPPSLTRTNSDSHQKVVGAYEYATWVFGEWQWGTLLNDRWEAPPDQQEQPQEQWCDEPFIEPPEGYMWDGDWVAGEYEESRVGITRKRKWLRRAIRME